MSSFPFENFFMVFSVGLLANFKSEAQFLNGATSASCASLSEPGFTAQTGPNPYFFTLSQDTYRSGDVIEVTLQSSQAQVSSFTAIICQARPTSGGSFPVGSFDIQDSLDYQNVICFDASTQQTSSDGTLTNVNSNPKLLPVTFSWVAPDSNVGDVMFVTTVVQSNGIFWESFQSQALSELVLNPPVITSCPVLIQTLSSTGGSVTVSWPAPAAVSGGQVARLLSQTHFPGSSLFPVGVTNVQYIFSDPSNTALTSTCDFNVEVLGPPILIRCPDDITVVSSSGSGAVVTWDAPSAVTSQGTIATMQSQTHFSGQFFPVGITCVEIIFIDPASGLIVPCLFKIIVLGPPIIFGCPGDQTVTSVQNTVTVTWVPPTAVSTTGIPLAPSATHAPGSLFPSPSTTIVMYSFTDPDSGLTSQCVFTVTVIRPDPPTLVNCPADITMSAALGTNVPVTFSPPSAVSQGQIVPCIPSQQVPPTFPVPSSTTIVYTCTDTRGLSVTCAFNVVITVKQSPPTVSRCPSDITLQGPPGAASVPITWIEPIAVTSSGLPAVVSSSFSPGDHFPIPTNVGVNYIFTDPQSGLQDNSCSFFITITSPPVIEAPTILGCPADVELNVNNAETVSVSWAEPTATSNTPGGTISVISTRVSGSTFLVPSTEVVVYTFSDSFAPGLTSECRFTVTVIGIDTIPPTIENCPGNIVLTTMVNTPTQAVSWIEPTATDRGQPVTGMSNFDPGDQFPTGTSTEVLYRFIDQAGNENQCTFVVSVTENTALSTPVCPTVPSVTSLDGNIGNVVSWTIGDCTDAQDGSITPVCIPSSGSFFDVGSTIVTCTCTDSGGLTSECSFNANVTGFIERDSKRDFSPVFEFCPRPISINGSSDLATTQITWMEPVFNASMNNLLLQQSHFSGDQFPIGITNVVYKLTDIQNRQSSEFCNFSITVNDITPPTIFNCPEAITVKSCKGGRNVSWFEPFASDNSGGPVTVRQTHSPGNHAFHFGTTNVSYIFKDESINVAECSFSVTVHGNGCFVIHGVLITVSMIAVAGAFIVFTLLHLCNKLIVPCCDKRDTADEAIELN